MPVSHDISSFIADTFINNIAGVLLQDLFIQTFTEHHDVGKVVYQSPMSNKAPTSKYVNVTVL